MWLLTLLLAIRDMFLIEFQPIAFVSARQCRAMGLSYP